MSIANIPAEPLDGDFRVTPIPQNQVPTFLGDGVRMTPDGRVDILDVISPMFSSKDAARQAIRAMLENTVSPTVNGFNPEQITRVRWTGQRGRYASLVTHINVVLAIALSIRTRGGEELKSAVATTIIRGLMKNQGYSDSDIARMEAKSDNPALTNSLTAAVGLPVPEPSLTGTGAPFTHNPIGGSATANPNINVTINNPSASPPRSTTSEDGGEDRERVDLTGRMVEIKPVDFAIATRHLERFERVGTRLTDDDDVRTFTKSTLTMYSKMNEAASQMAEAQARSAKARARADELDVEFHERRTRMRLAAEERDKALTTISASAELLNRTSSMTMPARYALARRVVELVGQGSLEEDEEGGGRLAITDGDRDTLQHLGIIPTVSAPRLSAKAHMESLIGSPIQDAALLKNLERDAFRALKATMGTDAVSTRGRNAAKFKYTTSELTTLDPVFKRYRDAILQAV
jgi:hypothetical protein